jgi:hypothetical protein
VRGWRPLSATAGTTDARTPVAIRHAESLREGHVFVAHVNVDKPAQLAAIIADPTTEAGVGGVQADDNLAERALGR